jgi:tetratricopeptide (TPR) repeat protein
MAMIGFWLTLFSLLSLRAKRSNPVSTTTNGIASRGARNDKDFAKIIFYVMLSFCVIFWAILTIQHNHIWNNPITFYENNLKYEPNGFIEHTNLGIAYADAGRNDDAIAQYEKAIAIADVYPQVHYDLANSLIAVKQYDRAEKEYLQTIKMDPQFGTAYQNLYNLYLAEGKKDEAQKILEEANK